MDKDNSQASQHGLINIENSTGEPVLHYVDSSQDCGNFDANAEMDMLESRLFAMAGSRS